MHLQVEGGDMGFVALPITDIAFYKAQYQNEDISVHRLTSAGIPMDSSRWTHPDGLSPHRSYDSHVLAGWQQRAALQAFNHTLGQHVGEFPST